MIGHRLVMSAVLLTATACSGRLPWLRGDLANQPALLVGTWVDVQKSSPADSSIWILEPNGEDRGMRITRGDDAKPRISRAHYGYWFARRDDAGKEELCITRRPSRDAPSCTAFVASIDSSTTPPRRMLRLAAYAGEHHTSERVLVEYQP